MWTPKDRTVFYLMHSSLEFPICGHFNFVHYTPFELDILTTARSNELFSTNSESCRWYFCRISVRNSSKSACAHESTGTRRRAKFRRLRFLIRVERLNSWYGWEQYYMKDRTVGQLVIRRKKTDFWSYWSWELDNVETLTSTRWWHLGETSLLTR